MPTARKWRMHDMCANCPFQSDGEGAHLRTTLSRWHSILAGLRRRESFLCHGTTEDTGNNTNLLCAGAIAYQEQHRTISQYQQVCERLDDCREERSHRGQT